METNQVLLLLLQATKALTLCWMVLLFATGTVSQATGLGGGARNHAARREADPAEVALQKLGIVKFREWFRVTNTDFYVVCEEGTLGDVRRAEPSVTEKVAGGGNLLSQRRFCS